MVESVLLSALARHHRYLPESCQDEGGWGGGSKNNQEDNCQVLPAGISALCEEAFNQVEEEVPNNERSYPDRIGY